MLKLGLIYVEIKMSALQIHTLNVSMKLNNNLMIGPLGTVNFVSLESQCFPRLRLEKH